MTKNAFYSRRILLFVLSVFIRFIAIFFTCFLLYRVIDATGFCFKNQFRFFTADFPLCPVYGLIGGTALALYSIDKDGIVSGDNMPVALIALVVAIAWAIRHDRRHGGGWA